MSGVGVNQQWELQKQLFRSGGLGQRPVLLQQLSLNGSMLLERNHDQRWLECLCRVMGQEQTTWSHLSRLLIRANGGDARRALWRASALWWQEEVDALPHLLELSWRLGQPSNSQQFMIAMEKKALQIRALRWCETGEGRRPISVLDLEQHMTLADETTTESSDR